MSVMKPKGFLITEHETGRVVFTNQRPSPEDMQEYELTGEAIYTAKQLAEAVAAEREKIVAEFQAECKMFLETSNPIDLGKTEVTKAIHAAIRSTTK